MRKSLAQMVLVALFATTQPTISGEIGPVQQSPTYQSMESNYLSNLVPTNVPGTCTFPNPPLGYNALTATDSSLAHYGFPLRPDSIAHPEMFARWKRVIVASKVRTTPVLTQETGIVHGPIKNPVQTINGSSTSSNWSGYENDGPATSFSSTSFAYVWADISVPVAQQAFGYCTGGWDYGCAWVGIDGDGSNDVMQAGVAFDAYCNGSNIQNYYYAWYEWAPNAAFQISNFPVAAGDDIAMEVWATSSTHAYEYICNMTTNQYSEMSFTAPSGYQLKGNCCEFIVERPTVNGSLATLTNYSAEEFWACGTETLNGQVIYLGTSPSPYTYKQVSMLDNNGNLISYPESEGLRSVATYVTGSAQ
jgi:Peptidase A4 family